MVILFVILENPTLSFFWGGCFSNPCFWLALIVDVRISSKRNGLLIIRKDLVNFWGLCCCCRLLLTPAVLPHESADLWNRVTGVWGSWALNLFRDSYSYCHHRVSSAQENQLSNDVMLLDLKSTV